MNVVFNFHGVDYIPAAALPYVTNTLLDDECVEAMFVNPEGFCDSQYDTVLQPYLVDAKGELHMVRGTSLAGWSAKPACNIVVREKAAREMFDMLDIELGQNNKLDGVIPIYDRAPTLPAPLADEILEKFSKPHASTFGRANGRPEKLEAFKAAFQIISIAAKDRGITLDPIALPGRKRDLFAILKKQNSKLSMEQSTFDDYANDLGWRWKQGARGEGARELLSIFGLEPQP